MTSSEADDDSLSTPRDSSGDRIVATFAEAAKHAASLATGSGLAVSIARTEHGEWAILDFELLAAIIEYKREYALPDDPPEDDVAENRDEESQQEITEELYGYQEDSVRSHEEGWYYED